MDKLIGNTKFSYSQSLFKSVVVFDYYEVIVNRDILEAVHKCKVKKPTKSSIKNE